MLVERRHEHHVRRVFRPHGLDDAEPIRRWNLDVEKYEIRPVPPDSGDRLGPCRGLADDFDVCLASEQPANLATRGLLVVDDQDAHARNGMAIATANPKPPLTCALPALNRWASPYSKRSRSAVAPRPTPLVFTGTTAPGPSSRTSIVSRSPSRRARTSMWPWPRSEAFPWRTAFSTSGWRIREGTRASSAAGST